MPPVTTSSLTLVVGDESVLVDRAVTELLNMARAGDTAIDVVELEPTDLDQTDLSVILSPSLFGDRRVVVLRAAQELSADMGKRLLTAVQGLPDEVTLVIVHAGGQKGRALLKSLGEHAGKRIDCPRVTKYRDRLEFVQGELGRLGATTNEQVARALLEAVGNDLADLAMACAQIVADTGGDVDADAIRSYYSGPAEVSGFAVADAAVDGDAGAALAQLRWALSTGVAPVLVTSALAGGVRQIARVASAGRGARAADLARDLGMPPWKVERVQRQARGWHPDGIATALAAVADADAAVKGAGVDPAYALERAVLAIAAARSGA